MNEWLSLFYNNLGIYNSIISRNLSDTYDSEPLGKHIKIIGGYAFKSSNYKNIGIPVIRISNFQNEKIDLSSAKYYDESPDLQNYELEEGDIIIAMTGGTIGKLAIVQSGLGKLYLNQRVGKLKVLNPDEFEAEYVYWIARGVESKIKELAWGAAIPNVSGKQIESLNFIIPPKNTQSRIVCFLNDLRDNKIKGESYFDVKTENEIIQIQELSINKIQIISETNHQIDLLKQLRQQILQDAVQGKLVPQDPNDEPASELLEKIKAEKEQLVREKKIKKGRLQEAETQEELLFDIPKNWIWCNLDEICSNITDGTHQTPTYTQSGRIFLSAQNVKPFRFMPDNHKYVTEDAYQEYIRNKKPVRGDILVARVGAGIGEAAVINQEIDFCFYVSLGLVQPIKEYTNSDYLTIVINSPYGVKYAKGNISSKGGSAGNFNLGRIRSFLIPFPSLPEQKRILNKVGELMTLCDELEQSIQQNYKYTQELLQVALKEALEPEFP